ncbi:MAG: biosynthetic-type acetolactate synthase large subunit [Croceivirga sp.]
MEKTVVVPKQKNKQTHQKSGAESVVLSLLAEGANLIFGYPGGAIMPVYDELFKYENQLKHILTRHEQGAIHAAQGYARSSGKTGVVLATSGPGATNLLTGIADAQIDSTPLVCITGQVASHLLGTDAFQETDIISMSTPVTKWNYQVTKASEIPEVLAKAFYIAKSGRPGPVLIDITKDAQFELAAFQHASCETLEGYTPNPLIDDLQIEAAAACINNAKNPMIIWGQGILLGKAEQEFKAFVEKSGIPAAWTILGASALPTAHPLNMGMLGMHGNYAPNVLTNECDVLLALGMRFDDRVTGNLEFYAKQAKIIHFEIDPAEINKNVQVDIPVLGDVKASLQKLIPLIQEKKYPKWYETFHQKQHLEFEQVIQRDLYPEKDGLTMGEVIKEINSASKNRAIIVSDVGQHQMVSCRYSNYEESRSHITSGGLGTMGFALPAALGAKLGDPKREVVAVIGDGGFQMTLQELGTIFQYGIAVKVVVLNNNFLGMVRQWQEMFFDGRYASTEMLNPDFVAIAKAYQLTAKRVSERTHLATTIQEMMASKSPYFLEVQVEKEANVFPMVPTGASVSEIRLK